MAYWLFKSEPGAWSWDDHVKAKVAEWDGVRNHQANANMRAMKLGDRAFFYHSVKEKQIVGIVEVAWLWYLDPTDPTGRFGMVDLKALYPVKTPVTLAQIKQHPALTEMLLIRHSRLSLCPVTAQEWRVICGLAGVEP